MPGVRGPHRAVESYPTSCQKGSRKGVGNWKRLGQRRWMSGTNNARSFQIAHLLAAGALGALGALLTQYLSKRATSDKAPIRVLITGAAGKGMWPSASSPVVRGVCGPLTVGVILSGQIGYALSSLVGHGELLGKNQRVILHLLDVDTATEPLNGLKLELIDSALPLLTGHKWNSFEKDFFALKRPHELIRLLLVQMSLPQPIQQRPAQGCQSPSWWGAFQGKLTWSAKTSWLRMAASIASMHTPSKSTPAKAARRVLSSQGP